MSVYVQHNNINNDRNNDNAVEISNTQQLCVQYDAITPNLPDAFENHNQGTAGQSLRCTLLAERLDACIRNCRQVCTLVGLGSWR